MWSSFSRMRGVTQMIGGERVIGGKSIMVRVCICGCTYFNTEQNSILLVSYL